MDRDFELALIELSVGRNADGGIAMSGGKDADGGNGVGVATRTRTRTKKPSPYKVLMLNDDYTPMEFVVQVLQLFFKMGIEDATRVMLAVHQRGVGVSRNVNAASARWASSSCRSSSRMRWPAAILRRTSPL